MRSPRGGGGPTPPPKPLAQAIHDALAAPAARRRHRADHVHEQALPVRSALGQRRLGADVGRLRPALGDERRARPARAAVRRRRRRRSSGTRRTVDRLRRLLEHRLQGDPPASSDGDARPTTDAPPTLAEIDDVPDEARRARRRSPARSRPTSAGSPPTRVASRRSTTAACSARWSSPGTPRTACRSASRSTPRAASSPVLELAVDRHLLRRRSRRATSTSRRPPGAKVVDLGARRAGGSALEARRHAGDRARRGAGRGRLPGRRARHARRAAAAGRPARRRRRLAAVVASTAKGSARSSSSSGRPTPRRRRAAMLSSLPTVSLDGLTAHELATQLGTVLEWQARRRRLRARRLASAGRGRGGGARASK